jgi:peptidoglycan/LPS O-acetylase OafA/YrhL
VVLFCGPRRLLPTCIAVIIVALALRMTLWIDGKPDVLAYMLTPCRMDTLAVGALLATLHRRTSSPRQLTAWAWAILLAGTSLLAGWAFRAGGLDHADPVVWTVGFTMIALAFGALIHLVAVSGDRSRVFAFARNPLLRSVGKYSYAIYIFHWLLAPGLYAHLLPEQWFFKHLRYVPGLLARFALVTALTYGIALVTWNLFEKQFLKLKRFLRVRQILAENCRRAGAAGCNRLGRNQLATIGIDRWH